MGPTVGQTSTPIPVPSSPTQQPPTLGQPAPKGPASIPLTQAPSTTSPRPPIPPIPQPQPQPQPSTHSPSELDSSHVAIYLPSHAALVSPDPTSQLPIPVGLVNEDMDVAPLDPPGPRGTSPLPHPLHEVPPPRPPDPCPLHQSGGVKPDAHDTTMEESGPPPEFLPRQVPNGPAVPRNHLLPIYKKVSQQKDREAEESKGQS
ncbi:hypothetical protein K2173_016375 [Erythroxylum novogranatense]|uniref:Uncharacterized protein n=1 Tax=Erythroxylum novogranatense TaxID=1862640 RepID=A0AAV8SGD2_9ROSI|nr:hypothetical protein K2173_016375 [Erythroxylum novogranatense]